MLPSRRHEIRNGHPRRRARRSNGRGSFRFDPTPEGLEDRTLLSFLPATIYPAGTAPSAVAVGDFTNDGHQDVVVVNGSTGTVSVLPGNGDGTFQPARSSAAGASPGPVAVGDLNGDGKLDLAIASTSGTGAVNVLMGNGDGTFQAAVTYTLGNDPASVAVGDINGDGRPDLVTANPGSGTVSVLLNNGDGTFGAETDYAAGASPQAVRVGDLNGDDHLDIIVPNDMSDGTVSILLGNGDGTLQPAESSPAGLNPTEVETGDFNGDGKLDLVVETTSASSSVQNTIALLPGNGDGTFGAPRNVTSGFGFQARSIVVADFNGDGHLDLAEPFLSGVAVELGRGDGAFYPGGTSTGYSTPFTAGLVAGDFNGDGAPDLAGPSNNSLMVADNAANDLSLLAGAVGFEVTMPSSTTAGSAFSITVTTVDASGNPVPGFRGTVYFTSSDPLMHAQQVAYPFNATDAGTHTFSQGLTLNTTGIQTVSVIAPFMTDSVSSIGVFAAAPSLSITGPSTATAGSPISETVTAHDALGNTLTSYTGTVHFNSSDVQAGLPADYTFTVADAGVHNFAVTLKTAGTQSITATDAAAPALSATQSGIVVTPAAATSFVLGSIQPLVIGGPGILAGTPESFTMFPADPFGNFVATYTGTANFTSTDPQAVLPPSYTFAGDGTVPFLTVSLRTAGTQAVIATDAALPSLAGHISFSISPAAPAALTLSGPSSAQAGSVQNVTVTARDAFGNVVTGFRDLLGDFIDGYTGTVTFSSSDVQAGLPASYTFTAADAGVHTFPVTFRTAGTQSITVTDTATPGMTSTLSGIVVTPAPAVSFVLGTPRVGLTGPTVTTAGVTQNFPVTAVDAFGNIATGYTGTVAFASTDAQAGLPASYTFTAADTGVKWFSETLKTAGTQSITVRDPSSPTLTNTLALAVTPAAAAALSVTGATGGTAGTVQNIAVIVRDAFGNVATGYTGTVAFSSSDAQVGLPAGYTFTAGDAGVHTFAAVLKTAGSQSITATDATTATITGAESGIIITAGAVTHLGLSGPTSATAGVSFTVKVSALDAYGNVVTGYRGKVHFSDSATNAGLPSDYTFSSGDNGVHSFSVTLNTVALQTLAVVDTANNTIMGSLSINVTAKSSGGGETGGGGTGGGGTGGGGTSGGSGSGGNA